MIKNTKFKNFIRGICYILPAMIILSTFTIYPSIKVFIMSFYSKYNYFKHQVFEYGLDNYISLFNDDNFIIALKNTLTFVFWLVPISIFFSTMISVCLVKNNKINSVIRSIYFLPFVTSTIAISVVYRWMFHSKYGIVNYFLSYVNINGIEWLTDSKFSMSVLIIVCVWKTLGYNILIILTGLRNIPDMYYSAAKIDGANDFEIFRSITLPLLSPTILFVSITSMIGAFKIFGEIYTLFNKSAGPLNSCLSMVYYIYDKLANQHSYGIASSASVVLFILILMFTLLQFYIEKRVNRKFLFEDNFDEKKV